MMFSLLSAVLEWKMDKEAAELTQFLSQVFPTLDDENLREIRIELVDKLGCDEVEYLQHATEDDLHFLKPLRRRKLLAAISESKHGMASSVLLPVNVVKGLYKIRCSVVSWGQLSLRVGLNQTRLHCTNHQLIVILHAPQMFGLKQIAQCGFLKRHSGWQGGCGGGG